jgi:glycosyltransferase involved in cell wall biosynthesis
MTDAAPLDATLLIATYNRAALLGETLNSIRALRVKTGRLWEVVVVDNNSTDATRVLVEQQAKDFPVPLRYVFEGRQGRSSALNAGLAASNARVVAMTDDDVKVDEGWLDAACEALEDPSVAYAGGPVAPMWESPPPVWLDLSRGDLWGTIAIQDHGDRPFMYEEARRVPLGANMAARRSLFGSIGGFRTDLGRTSGRLLLGQEVPELLMRARAAGLRGMYVPAMRVHHHIPSARLTRRYFRKWWYGKGVSRSALERMQPVTELGLDLRTTPHVLGVPRYMFGSAARDVVGCLKHLSAGRPADAFRHEMMLVFFAGYVRARLASAFQAPVKPRGRAIHEAAPEIQPSNSSVVWLVESTNRGSSSGLVRGVASPGSQVVADDTRDSASQPM